MLSSLRADKKIINFVSEEIESLHESYPELLIEYKGLSIAVHYRLAPQLEDAVKTCLQALAELYLGQLEIQQGKMVCELRLSGMDKGKAIKTLLEQKEFFGHTPIFIGDDATDEDGFKAVNALGGISIKIGGGQTAANYKIDNTEELSEWLQQL